MTIRAHIESAADAYGEDALGPVFAKPLVIETDIERADREEREWEAESYAEWVASYQAWEREWWDRDQDRDTPMQPHNPHARRDGEVGDG